MKLRRIEKLAIAAAVLIFALFAGYAYGTSAARDGTFYVHSGREAPPDAVMLGGDTQRASALPAADTAAPAASPAGGIPAAGGKININTATAEELGTLPGIGPTLAERIIAYREQFGAFQSEDCIMDVQGIGEKTYEDLRDLITVTEGKQ